MSYSIEAPSAHGETPSDSLPSPLPRMRSIVWDSVGGELGGGAEVSLTRSG